MPSLPRSIVGGLNPEGGGEAPNAPKPPCFCGRETLSCLETQKQHKSQVVVLLSLFCSEMLLLVARQSGGSAEEDV